MDIPPPPSELTMSSFGTGLAAIFLTLLAISDLTASALPEEISTLYWSSLAPVRLVFFFGLTAWAYLGKPGPEDGFAVPDQSTLTVASVGMREMVCNSFVFSWGFLEMVIWFWVDKWLLILWCIYHDANGALDLYDAKGGKERIAGKGREEGKG